jgi:CheY-like chemotaxis protein
MLDLFRYRVTEPEFNHLPAADRQMPSSNYSIRSEKGLPQPFVLILGKDNDTRFLFKTAFELWNYEVAEACNAEQSLQLCTYKIPNLVLMDTEFDLTASLTAMKQLRGSKLFTNCGFILVSGHAQENIRRTALAAGADFFLVKPIDFEILRKFLWIYFNDRRLAIS